MEENVYMLSDVEICRRIGLKLQRLRLRQNITQTSLAEQTQVSVSTVKRIEDGEISSFDSFMRILRVLGELDIFAPLLKEEEMSPNEYYEFVESKKRKQRKRASAQKDVEQSKTYEEESEW